jgi:hypothetical protein
MQASLRGRASGSRFLYEPFDPANARVEALERVLDERWASLERTLKQVETHLDRLERRLWQAVFGVAAALMGEFAALILFGIFKF